MPLIVTIKGIEQDKFNDPEFVDLTLTFVDESILVADNQEKNIEGVPTVRVIF